MDKLSVVILTKNEEAQIRKCLESIKWADEIIIVDDFSTDRTLQICREYTDKIFQKKLEGFSAQREFGAFQAGGPWVLHLDADEVVTPALQEEIKEILEKGTDCDGFLIYRPTVYLGRLMRYCGWRARPLLLFRKNKGRYDGRLVHERISVDGKIGCLRNEIIHKGYKNLSEHFAKMDLYTTYDAEELWRKGKRLNIFNYPVYFILKPSFIFFRRYIIQRGFKEGLRGLFISVITAFIVFMNYAKLWEKQKNAH
ncbi:MAG: glycosyltransferase family 2 protein [Candidatus Omnitrophica bacterium]|nr:glycosyltransferase family 2 protein [Candidatus Omnitrophota bacterium]